MKKKHFSELDTDYDVELLIRLAKKRLTKVLFLLGLYSIIFVTSVLAVIFWGNYVPVFIIGIVAACISALLCGKLIKNFAFSDYSSTSGEIENVHKEVTAIRTTKVGGVNPFGARRYDNDVKNEIRLEVFIKDGEKIRSYFLNDVTEYHTKYYEAKGEAIHIWGTHFPVKLEVGKDKWLCPICGEFNANKEKTCARCKKKMLK